MSMCKDGDKLLIPELEAPGCIVSFAPVSGGVGGGTPPAAVKSAAEQIFWKVRTVFMIACLPALLPVLKTFSISLALLA